MARTAIVTGGASGIGMALAGALVADGAHVVVADVDGARAAEVTDRLRAGGPGTADAAVVDVRDAEAVQEAVSGIHARHGLDLMFNNAGIAFWGRPEELTVAHWHRMLDVNLRGVIHGCVAAYPLMAAQGHGHLVNTASLAGLYPTGYEIPYVAAKHAVVGLSLAWRSAAEATRSGVRVSVICPGWIDTPLLDTRAAPPDLPPIRSDGRIDARSVARLMRLHTYPADRFAADVLRGIARGDAMIVRPRSAWAMWQLWRISPAAGRALDRRTTRRIFDSIAAGDA